MPEEKEPARGGHSAAPATGPLSGAELLTTTRSVRRRLDLDRSVDVRLVREALSMALQAPNGSNDQPWQWIVVTDPARRRRLAECYRRAAGPYLDAMAAQAAAAPERRGVWRASVHLAEHLHRVPVLVVPCLSVSPADFEARFADLGFPPPMHLGLTVHVAGDSTTPAAGPGDLLLACSGSGETPTTLAMAENAARAGVRIAVVTADAGSSLARRTDLLVHLPEYSQDHEPGRSAQFVGTLFEQGALLFFDSLILAYEQLYGTEPRDMLAQHTNLE